MNSELNIELNEVEEESFSDDALFNISSYGVDMSFRELISMYKEGDLEKPEMQRKYVWGRKEASRFIDSVLLGLPVPSIFLAKTKDEKRLIVDGYQRIMTVYDYVETGIFSGDGQPFKLSNSSIINEKWRGKLFSQLDDTEKRKIRNASIHAIVFEQKQPQDDSGMYQIFERINTSGRVLKPQEIRNCIYHGSFNQLLSKLNKNTYWRELINTPEDARMLDIELILRCFAFSDFKTQDEVNQTQINLVKYLNSYMEKHSDLSDVESEEFNKDFDNTIEFIAKNIGVHAFRNANLNDEKIDYSKKINPSIMDSVYSATSFVIKKHLSLPDGNIIKTNYESLLLNEDYKDAISTRTTNVSQIKKRINLASKMLYGVEYEW